MLVSVGYEQNIHSNIYCYKSLYGVSVPILVTGCWISSLGYTRQGFSIQVGCLSCWYILLLFCSGNIDIFHREHLWCLKDIWHWWGHCMLIDCRQDRFFCQYQLILHQPGWYLPNALFWCCVCCAGTLLGIYLWWVPSTRFFVVRSVKKLAQ